MTLHPDFPVVEGTCRLTEDWSVVLPASFNKRIEDGDIVIWKPGFTIWTAIWNNDEDESQRERLRWLQDETSPDAFDEITEAGDGLIRYAYRLEEGSDDQREAAFYCFAIGDAGHVQMAIYFDSTDDIPLAKEIWQSLSEQKPEG